MDAVWLRRAALPLAVSAVLVAVGLAARLTVGTTEPAPLALRLLDVNRERNLPTAWSVALLLGCCAAAVRLGRQRRREGWGLVAAVAALMALDEGVRLHERTEALGRVLAGDALHFAWVVPGALAAGTVLLALVRALRGAPRVLRRRLGLAGALYLTGALLVETVSGVVLDVVGRGVVYALANAVEEGLEMTGASLALAALLVAADPGRHVRRPPARAQQRR